MTIKSNAKQKPVFQGRVVRSLGVVALVAVALTACRAEEQDRMIRFEPGIYKGKPDARLSRDRVEQLRGRTLSQGGISLGGGGGSLGGGGGSSAGTDVRAPIGFNERAKP